MVVAIFYLQSMVKGMKTGSEFWNILKEWRLNVCDTQVKIKDHKVFPCAVFWDLWNKQFWNHSWNFMYFTACGHRLYRKDGRTHPAVTHWLCNLLFKAFTFALWLLGASMGAVWRQCDVSGRLFSELHPYTAQTQMPQIFSLEMLLCQHTCQSQWPQWTLSWIWMRYCLTVQVLLTWKLY